MQEQFDKVLEDKVLEEYDRMLSEDYEKTKLCVMVLGPNTDKTTPGAQLREFIVQQCRVHGIGIKGERDELINTYRERVGSKQNLCSMERHFAHRVANALVIIPDSAGSLVELGMFAFDDKISFKTLVLFSDEYPYELETQPSFIQVGPKLAYEARRVPTLVVNYKEKELVWEKVDEFLQDIRIIEFDKGLGAA